MGQHETARHCATINAARAAALFTSCLATGSQPSRPEATHAITIAVRSRGCRGCVAELAAEYGDHPETAIPRMRWALDVVHTLYEEPATSRPTGTPARAAGTALATR